MASTEYVGGSGKLNEVINVANDTLDQDQQLTIYLQHDITLAEDIDAINTAGVILITPAPGLTSVTIDGAGKYRGFIVLSGDVRLSGLRIHQARASGPDGCLGAGGGLFVANVTDARGQLPKKQESDPDQVGNPYFPKGGKGSVSLTGVTFTNCSAVGGKAMEGGGKGAAGGSGGGPFTDPNGGFPAPATPFPGGRAALGYPLGPRHAGYFGVVGSGGRSVAGGRQEDARARVDASGKPGSPGGQGGYGAAGGVGGGGGGGAGGAGHFPSLGRGPGGPPSVSGSIGGAGGACGTAGYGAGTGGTTHLNASDPEQGKATEGSYGGAGGKGGDGAPGGGGAGLGGAVFAMSGASLSWTGSGSISAGQVAGGQSGPGSASGTAVGAGMYLEGSGVLTFGPDQGATCTVGDPIVDETGVVSAIPATTTPPGPDGLSTRGGTGSWRVVVARAGTLTLRGPHAFTGGFLINGATDAKYVTELNLSDYSNAVKNDLLLCGNAMLTYRPSSGEGTQLALTTITSGPQPLLSARFALNAHSSVTADEMRLTELRIVLNPDDFIPGTPVDVLRTQKPIGPEFTVSVSQGFDRAIVNQNTIRVTRNKP